MKTTGRIEVIVGSMFSGKTEELIRRVRRAQLGRQFVQAFKPAVDNRYDESRIVSHEDVSVVGQYHNQSIDAVPVESSQAIPSMIDQVTRVVAIDEAQFFDDGIVGIANQLADQGLRVILAGLDLDYRAKPFGPMPALMAIAEEVHKVRAVCSRCGADACRSQRIATGSEGQILVGGKEVYEARCRACFNAGRP